MNRNIFYYNGGTDFIPLDNVPLNSSVENMAEDFEGNLWFAAKRQGVMKVTANRFMDLNAKAGIEAKNVNAVCIRDGLIYIGTDTGLQLVNSSYTPVDNMLTSALPDVNIRCLTVDNDNTIWASTFTNERGIIGLTEEGVILFFTEDYGLPGNKIYCTAVAPDGSLLTATDNGLAVIKDGEVKRVINADNGLKNPIILTAEADEDGKYFLGSDGDGLYVVDGSSITHFSRDEGLTSDVVMRVKNDKQRGIVWIITSNSIQYYKDGEIRTVEGFPYTSNYDIYFDKHGNAWVLSANGIYVASADDMLSKSQYDYSFYNTSDGLHSLPTPNSYSYLDSNGDLYISGRSGVSVINIDSDQTQDQDIRFKVSYISDGNNKYYPDENNTFTLPSSADNITVYCSALTYSLHDPQIQYYMEGFDDKPVTVNKSGMGPVRYTNLSGGEYEFQMSVIDGRTHNAKNTVEFKIIKQRSFYEHWAFFVLCGAFVLLMMVFIVWLIIRKKNEKLRKQEEEQKKIQRLFEQTATALVNAIDAKDKYTHGHSSRVAKYSRKLAEMLGKDEQECNEVYYAGLLHDVGKIGVPENIINKDGRLTDEEFEKIKQHPDMGAQILQSIDEYPYLSLGARYHHERYDGKGYLQKLKGTDIPEFARIISVADSYDAMTSKRSYRDPIPQQKVREEFVKGMGSQFDPEYARLMLHLIDLDTEYTMKEREVIKEFSGKSELVIDKFKSTVSDGIPITPQMTTIRFRISPKTGSGAPPVPTLVLFDSLDGRVHSDEKEIRDLLYFEYAEIRLDGKTVVKGARKIVTDQRAKGSEDIKSPGHHTLEAVKVKDHVQIKIYSSGSAIEVTAALPDSSRFAYIGLTGENCRISDVKIDKAESVTPADKIKRIAEEISYIDVPAGDIPNVQIDGYRTAASEGIPVKDGMKLKFHAKSLPTARLVWHCPYIDIFTSDDGKVNGVNYIDRSFMRIDGECWQNGDAGKAELVVNKNDDFTGWDNWKKLNKDGLECTVTFEKQGNTVTVITENGGILIRVKTELFDAADKTVYAALTGDQCAITNIRIINKD